LAAANREKAGEECESMTPKINDRFFGGDCAQSGGTFMRRIQSAFSDGFLAQTDDKRMMR
jgi:hypothetical protein